MGAGSSLVLLGSWEVRHIRARPLDGIQSNTVLFVSARPLAKQARSDSLLGKPQLVQIRALSSEFKALKSELEAYKSDIKA